MIPATEPLLQLTDIRKRYWTRAGLLSRPAPVQAVAGVSFTIARGEVLGLVGESGCGKSTTGRLALGLEPPDSGDIRFDQESIAGVSPKAWRRMRRRMQIVFQDPLAALDRRLTASTQIAEPLAIHRIGDSAARVADLLTAVGLSPDQGRRYPHELSGGQRQRVVIARALAAEPDFLVCDEPVAALDVSIQAQVVNLLMALQAQRGLAMLFISHDLRIVRQVSHRVAVMYLGQIVELADADGIFADPLHPYTRILAAASLTPGRRRAPPILAKGEPPEPANRPGGCTYHPRCPFALPRCRTEAPVLQAGRDGRLVACHIV